YDSWRSKKITLPAGAKGPTVYFKFEAKTSGPNYDHYAIDNLIINGATLPVSGGSSPNVSNTAPASAVKAEGAESPTTRLNGTNFHASSGGIFSNSFGSGSVTDPAMLAPSGLGTGAFGSFKAHFGSWLFGFYGKTDANKIRRLTTGPINTTSATTMQFYLIEGNQYNGGNNPEPPDTFTVSYSQNGSTWTTLWEYIPANTYDSWTNKSITLPSAAKRTTIYFRFEAKTTGADYDHYAMDNLIINGATFTP
ncbi:uncharacterized protein METZ01_LOCUS359179, partial [marine metagenome]